MAPFTDIAQQLATLSSAIFSSEHALARSESTLSLRLAQLAQNQSLELQALEVAHLQRVARLCATHASQIEDLKQAAEREMRVLQTSTQTLIQIRDSLCRLGQSQRNDSPTHNLPTEILSQIFLHSLEDDDYRIKPLILSSVCRRWRQVAKGYSRLWSRITILDSSRFPLQLLRLWTSHLSKSVNPVSISLHILGLDSTIIQAICAVLQPFMARCRVFELDPVMAQRGVVVKELFGQGVERLEELRVGHIVSDSEMRDMVSGATKLAVISAPRMSLPLTILHSNHLSNSDTPDIPNIRVLDLRTITISNDLPGPRLNSLVNLSLREIPAAHLIARISLPALETLSLSPHGGTINDILNVLRICPVLTTATIRLHSNMIGPTSSPALLIPTLRSLCISATQFVPSHLPTSLLTNLSAPSLSQLYLRIINLPQPLTLTRFLKTSGGGLRVLEIGERVWAVHESISSMILEEGEVMYLPNLQDLTIHHVDPSRLLHSIGLAQPGLAEQTSLRSLILTGRFKSEMIMNLLRQSPFLENLDLESGMGQHVPHVTEQDNTQSIPLHHLTHLRLHDVEPRLLLPFLYTPHVTHLSLIGSYVVSRNILPSLRQYFLLSAPDVEVMEMACGEMAGEDWKWLLTKLEGVKELRFGSRCVGLEGMLKELGRCPEFTMGVADGIKRVERPLSLKLDCPKLDSSLPSPPPSPSALNPSSPPSPLSSYSLPSPSNKGVPPTSWPMPNLTKLTFKDCSLSWSLLVEAILARNRYTVEDGRRPARIAVVQIQDWVAKICDTGVTSTGTWIGKREWGDVICQALNGQRIVKEGGTTRI